MLQFKYHPARDWAIMSGAALLFGYLAWLASLGGPPGFDLAVRGTVHGWASPWLTEVMKVASLVGSGFVLWPAGVLTVGLLARAGRQRDALRFAVAVAGANLVSEAMKLFFHRQRPEAWFGYPLPTTYSFPSGHALVGFCFFLCLAEILVRDEWTVTGRVAMWCAALACTLTIGLSRVYLGVHYPSDVLAGYAVAILWTTLIRVAHHTWRARGPAKARA